jgi:hypothetical protein
MEDQFAGLVQIAPFLGNSTDLLRGYPKRWILLAALGLILASSAVAEHL